MRCLRTILIGLMIFTLVTVLVVVNRKINLTYDRGFIRSHFLSKVVFPDLQRKVNSLLPLWLNEDTHNKKATNIYWLKFHVAGSVTLNNIFARFAWRHDLRVATFEYDPYIRYQPGCLVSYLYPPFLEGESERYNFVLDHSYFEPEDISEILHHPIRYVSMIRHPISWLTSYLHMKNWISYLKLNESDIVSSFIDKLGNKTLSEDHKKKIRHAANFTNYIFNFKSAHGSVGNNLEDIDKVFLMGIYEFYNESLILMRRAFNWTLKDVLYNAYKQYQQRDFDVHLYKRFCQKMPDQCFFYEHFNRSFSERVEREGQSFQEEVKYFKSALERIAHFCAPAYESLRKGLPPDLSESLKFDHSRWHEEFIYTYEDCLLSRTSTWSFRSLLYYRQNLDASCNEMCPIHAAHIDENICKKKTSDKNKYFNDVIPHIKILV